jgi:hypothetical protein
LVFYDAFIRAGLWAWGDGQGVAPAEVAGSADRQIARKANEIRFPCTKKNGQSIGRQDKK